MIIPKRMPYKNWAASIIQDFGTDNVPILTDDKKWKVWGSFLSNEKSFASQGAPIPSGFKSKEKWADAMFNSMTNF